MIARPRKKVATPNSRVSMKTEKRRLQRSSSAIETLLVAGQDFEDVERRVGNRDRTGVEHLMRFVIAPAGADARRTGGDRHAHVEGRIADDDRRLRRSPGIGHRLMDHGWVRLGWMPVGRLQRDKARRISVAIEAERKAAIGLARGDGEQPAIGFQDVEQFRDARKERLLNAAFCASALEMPFIALRQQDMPLRLLVRHERRNRLHETESDDPAAHLLRGHGHAMLSKRVGQSGEDVAPAVDQGPVAIKDRQLVHFRLVFTCPRDRRSPRLSLRRDLATAATFRFFASGDCDGLGWSSGMDSPCISSKPSVARLSAMCGGRSAVTSMTPSGASMRIRRAWRWSLRLIPPVRKASGPPYLASPTMGWPIAAMCARSWCVRPVSG